MGRGTAAKRWWRGRATALTFDVADPSVSPAGCHLPIAARGEDRYVPSCPKATEPHPINLMRAEAQRSQREKTVPSLVSVPLRE
jgi:hypothetical protein